MNTQMSSMRFLTGMILALGLLCLVPGQVYAQDLSIEEALQIAQTQSRKAGFSQVFFPKSTIGDVLEGSVHIEVSNGWAVRRSVLMVVGLDADGNETGSFIQSDALSGLGQIDLALYQAQIDALNTRRGMTSVTSTFTSAELQDMLDSDVVNGLIFVPSTNSDGAGGTVMTLAVGAASSPRSLSPGMMLRRSPCPPDCDF